MSFNCLGPEVTCHLLSQSIGQQGRLEGVGAEPYGILLPPRFTSPNRQAENVCVCGRLVLGAGETVMSCHVLQNLSGLSAQRSCPEGPSWNQTCAALCRDGQLTFQVPAGHKWYR